MAVPPLKTILFLLDRYPGYGGIETVTTCLANALGSCYRIILCAVQREHGAELLPQLTPQISYRPLPLPTTGYNRENLTAFRRILRDEKVELVIYQDSYAANDYLPLSVDKDSGIKLIVVEHSSPSMACRWLRVYLAACPWWNIPMQAKVFFFGVRGVLRSRKRRTALYKHCDTYILLSHRLRQEFLQNSHLQNTDKLEFIGNPVSYSPGSINFAEKKKQVLFIGQFVPDKGIFSLLRIWERVFPHASDWELVLIGDGPLMDETKKYIADKGLPRVSLKGYCNTIRDYCRDASILCMCSSFEGFPMVLPEAMCSGAVPISYDTFSAIDDIFTDGVSGCKIPAFDEECYAARLLELMKNDDKRQHMAQAALARSDGFRQAHFITRWRQTIAKQLARRDSEIG